MTGVTVPWPVGAVWLVGCVVVLAMVAVSLWRSR